MATEQSPIKTCGRAYGHPQKSNRHRGIGEAERTGGVDAHPLCPVDLDPLVLMLRG